MLILNASYAWFLICLSQIFFPPVLNHNYNTAEIWRFDLQDTYQDIISPFETIWDMDQRQKKFGLKYIFWY